MVEQQVEREDASNIAGTQVVRTKCVRNEPKVLQSLDRSIGSNQVSSRRLHFGMVWALALRSPVEQPLTYLPL
jgi:hypothetical protein